MNNLGCLHLRRGAAAPAEALFRQACAIDREAEGEQAPAYLQSLGNLASALEQRAEEDAARLDFASASKAHQESAALRTRLLGTNHPRAIEARLLAAHVERLARLDSGQRRRLAEADRVDAEARTLEGKFQWQDAVPLAAKALAIRKSLLGEDDLQYALGLSFLGRLYQRLGDADHAGPLLELARKTHEKLHGRNHPRYAEPLNDLGELFLWRGNLDRAELYLADAWKVRKEALGEQHADAQASRRNLALARERRSARDAQAERRRRLGPSSSGGCEAPSALRRRPPVSPGKGSTPRPRRWCGRRWRSEEEPWERKPRNSPRA